MESYISNITNLKKTENNISFTHEGRQHCLTITISGDSITLQLKEANSVINYTGTMLLSEITKEKLFSHCETIDELKDIINQVISEGKIILQKDNTYMFTLFNKPYSKFLSADVFLKEEEVLDNENILHRVDGQLKSLMKIEDVIRLNYNTLNESIKANNNVISFLRDEIKSQLREHSESRLKVNEEKIFKAVNEFDNYILHIDSLESFINKMGLYKYVLMNLEDDIIGKWLKDGFCSLYNVISNEVGISLKEKLTELKVKEECLNQTVKELKDHIFKQNYKEEDLTHTIKELKDEITKQNAKEEYLSKTLKELKEEILRQNANAELNKNYNDNYKTLNQSINNLNEEINTIKLFLESKQHNNSKLAIEARNFTFSNKMLVNSQNTIKDNLLNKIKENILFSEEKLKTLKSSDIIGEHADRITSMISLPNDYIATASYDKSIEIWDLNKKTFLLRL
jgi:WD40 repeat protein